MTTRRHLTALPKGATFPVDTDDLPDGYPYLRSDEGVLYQWDLATEEWIVVAGGAGGGGGEVAPVDERHAFTIDGGTSGAAVNKRYPIYPTGAVEFTELVHQGLKGGFIAGKRGLYMVEWVPNYLNAVTTDIIKFEISDNPGQQFVEKPTEAAKFPFHKFMVWCEVAGTEYGLMVSSSVSRNLNGGDLYVQPVALEGDSALSDTRAMTSMDLGGSGTYSSFSITGTLAYPGDTIYSAYAVGSPHDMVNPYKLITPSRAGNVLTLTHTGLSLAAGNYKIAVRSYDSAAGRWRAPSHKWI